MKHLYTYCKYTIVILFFLTTKSGFSDCSDVSITTIRPSYFSVQVDWTSTNPDILYTEIEVKLASATEWATYRVMGSPFIIPDLQKNSRYNIRLRDICISGSGSFVDDTFLTANCGAEGEENDEEPGEEPAEECPETSVCSEAAGLSATITSPTSANLFWEESGDPDQSKFLIRYKKTSESEWLYGYVFSANDLLLTDLEAVEYEYQVGVLCSGRLVLASNGDKYSESFRFELGLISCFAPTTIGANNISTSSATLTWASETSSLSFEARYKPSTSNSWTDINSISSNSVTLTNLSSGTSYNFDVKSICTGTLTSNYSTYSFNTNNEACNIPNNISTSGFNNTSATILWDAISNATTYGIEYKASSASTWLTRSANTNQITLTNLSPSTSYQVKIRATCNGQNNLSAFSSPITFSTEGSSPSSVLETDDFFNLIIAPNPNSGVFTIQLPNNIYRLNATNIQIKDIIGKVVYTTTLTTLKEQQVNVSLPNGLYFISVEDDRLQGNKKLLINNNY